MTSKHEIPNLIASCVEPASDDSYLRKYILSSYRVYTNYFAEISSLPNPVSQDVIITSLKHSINYREKYKELLSSVDDYAGIIQRMKGDNDPQIQELIKVYDTVRNIEKIWNLFEITYLNPSQLLSLDFFKWLKTSQDSSMILSQRWQELLTYYQDISTYTTYNLTTSIPHNSNNTTIDNHDDYWPLIFDFLTYGELIQIFELLSLHPKLIKLFSSQPILAHSMKRLFSTHPYAIYIQSDKAIMDSMMSDSKQQLHMSNTDNSDDDNIFQIPSQYKNRNMNKKTLNNEDDDDDNNDMTATFTIKDRTNKLKEIHDNTFTLPMKLKEWQSNIKELQTSFLSFSHSLGCVVPEMTQIFNILLGNNDSIKQESHGQYIRYIMLQLLYIHSPPLSQSDIVYLIHQTNQYFDSMETSFTQDTSSSSNDDHTSFLRTILTHIFTGDFVSILTYIYDLCHPLLLSYINFISSDTADTTTTTRDLITTTRDLITTTATTTTTQTISTTTKENNKNNNDREKWTSWQIDMTLLALQTCVHLYDLLVKSETVTDITLPLQNTPITTTTTAIDSSRLTTTCSYLEQITLQLSQLLISHSYPIEVVIGYLVSCPIYGQQYAAKLLLIYPCETDNDVFRMSHLLKLVDYTVISPNILYLHRGDYWYKHGTRDGIIRALYFYQLAGDSTKTTAILERVWWAALCTVCSSFPIMIKSITTHPNTYTITTSTSTSTATLIYPPQPTVPLEGYSISNYHQINTRISNGINEEIYKAIPDDLQEKVIMTDLSMYWNDKYWPESYIKPSSTSNTDTIMSLSEEKISSNTLECDNMIVATTSTTPPTTATSTTIVTDIDHIHDILQFIENILATITTEKSIHQQEYVVYLTYYQSFLSLLLQALSTCEYIENTDMSSLSNEELILIYEQCFLCVQYYYLAGNRLFTLLSTHPVPKRYWLSLLSMCMWIEQHSRHRIHILKQIIPTHYIPTDITLIMESLADNTRIMGVKMTKEIMLYDLKNDSIYTQEMTYQLSTYMIELEMSYNSKYFFSHVPMNVLKEWRQHLLNLYSVTSLQENKRNGDREKELVTQEKARRCRLNMPVIEDDLQYYQLLTLDCINDDFLLN